MRLMAVSRDLPAALLLLLVVLIGLSSSVSALNGNGTTIDRDFATFHDVPFALSTALMGVDDHDDSGSRRQDLCSRYEAYRHGNVTLRHALRQMQLHVLMPERGDRFFRYSNTTGIAQSYPGLTADLMDRLAIRAGFTWRQSFGTLPQVPTYYNLTYTEMLWWAVNTYDIAVGRYDRSLERMELGISYMEPFFDGSIILLDKIEATVGLAQLAQERVYLGNWLRPFTPDVWALTLVTIVVSALIYQFIEFINGERQARSMGQWIMDNLYLSVLSAAQNFEYAPSTAAGRIFAVSMTFWSLVMTATYTANLASLFVDENKPVTSISTMEEAAALQIPICVLRDTNMDILIKQRYQGVNRIPKLYELEMYQALNNGECQLLAEARSSWEELQHRKAYNPDCDLKWVGRTVQGVKSGFAVKADVGYKCTSLIRDVFNLHIHEMERNGELDDVWKMHESQIKDANCNDALDFVHKQEDYTGTDDRQRQRQLGGYDSYWNSDNDKKKKKSQQSSRRKLEGGAAGSFGGKNGGNDENTNSLTLRQMAGTFVFHYGMMFLAMVTCVAAPFWRKLEKSLGWAQPEQVIVRSHGPMVGSPPKRTSSINGENRKSWGINTYVMPQELAPLDEQSLSNPNCAEKRKGDLDNLQKQLTADLQAQREHTERKLDDHMGMVVMVLNEVRKQNRQLQNQVQVVARQNVQLQDQLEDLKRTNNSTQSNSLLQPDIMAGDTKATTSLATKSRKQSIQLQDLSEDIARDNKQRQSRVRVSEQKKPSTNLTRRNQSSQLQNQSEALIKDGRVHDTSEQKKASRKQQPVALSSAAQQQQHNGYVPSKHIIDFLRRHQLEFEQELA
ncbi:Glutamate receptor, ionotropic [Seminavis robusta]|uniref:Glutamate receptor, ionotropic n=1 Tax=Seminavis robusta TaxID=568900 RepID=A0A9N8HGT8_9STRA|nr:Glutamate receptor, ionotropic [Seminavis robusta]|eukprot:Sro412_g137970.1 Glutamate receptor, ionotropic (845) ;mRNA; f:57619-60340